MKTLSKRISELKPAVMLISFLFLTLLFSCRKDELDKDLPMMNDLNIAPVESSVTTVVCFPEETFRITTKGALVQTRSLANSNFGYFDSFILKVQNSTGKTRVQKVEVLVDGNTVVSSADFRKNTNLVVKPLPGLTATSSMVIRLLGTTGRFIKVQVEGYLKAGVIADIDNNFYNIVKIGSKWWTKENLRTTRFNDGTPLHLGTEDEDFLNASFDAPASYCFYNNDVSYKQVYGALYNFIAASISISEKELCPVGWHVSSYEDFWDALKFLDPSVEFPYELTMGGAFKEEGTTHWLTPNTGATNSTGFTGLPGGRRMGPFSGLGEEGTWWLGFGERFGLSYNSTEVYYNYDVYLGGFSIRCVKNE
jgi:uncharacterized protein (TIGR02145 family)